MISHQLAGLGPIGGERALRVGAPNSPVGGPQRLADRAHAAGRVVLVERGHRPVRTARLLPASALAIRARCTREVLEFSSVPVGTTTFPSGPTASRSAATTAGAPPCHPAERPERGVHEQGLARLDAKPAQVADEPLLRHRRADGPRSSHWSRLRMACPTLRLSLPCRPALGGPARAAAVAPRPVPARRARARRWRACRRRSGRRAGSARRSLPASRSPPRSASASGRTARPPRARPGPVTAVPAQPASSRSRRCARRCPAAGRRAGAGRRARARRTAAGRSGSHRSNMSSSAPSLTCWNSWMMQQRQVSPSAGSAAPTAPNACLAAALISRPGTSLASGMQRGQPGRDARPRRPGSPARSAARPPRTAPASALTSASVSARRGRPLVAVPVGVGVLQADRERPRIAARGPAPSPRSGSASASWTSHLPDAVRTWKALAADGDLGRPRRRRPAAGRAWAGARSRRLTGTVSSASVPALMAAAAAIDARWAASAGSAAVSAGPQAALGPGPHVRVREHLGRARPGAALSSRASSVPAGQEELVGARASPAPGAAAAACGARCAAPRLSCATESRVAEPGRERVEVGVRQLAGRRPRAPGAWTPVGGPPRVARG